MTEQSARQFEPWRSYLTGVAYRMLGSVSEAEDVVQDAYLRWHHTDTSAVNNVQAFLTKITSRLCLDRLKTAHRQRETYIGPWLPEPLVELSAGPAEAEDLASDVSFALMLALERLSPLERAAFLLHDVFGLDFADVASSLERSEATCRQLARRARRQVQIARPRYPVAPGRTRTIVKPLFRRPGPQIQITPTPVEAARFRQRYARLVNPGKGRAAPGNNTGDYRQPHSCALCGAQSR